MYKKYNHKKYIESHKYVNRENIFKKGDWVMAKNKNLYRSNIPCLVETVYLGNGKCPQQIDIGAVGGSQFSVDYELWKPQFGELCIFFLHDSKSYRIARFQQIGFGSGREGQFKDTQGNYFDNIAPLEFIDGLKRFEETK